MFQDKKLGLVLPTAERLEAVPTITHFFNAAAALPLVADTADYGRRLPTKLWGMLGNDEYGCCFWSAIANILMAQDVNAGVPVKVWTRKDVLGWYQGYLKTQGINFDPTAPSDPNTDVGTDPIAGMQWAQAQGLIRAWGQVPIKGNDMHYAAGVEHFGGLILGVSVPSGWMSSTTWGPNAGPVEGGHAIVGNGFNQALDTPCLTWSDTVNLTYAGKAQYGQCAFACITDAWLGVNGKTLQGFQLGQLQQLLRAVV